MRVPPEFAAGSHRLDLALDRALAVYSPGFDGHIYSKPNALFIAAELGHRWLAFMTDIGRLRLFQEFIATFLFWANVSVKRRRHEHRRALELYKRKLVSTQATLRKLANSYEIMDECCSAFTAFYYLASEGEKEKIARLEKLVLRYNPRVWRNYMRLRKLHAVLKSHLPLLFLFVDAGSPKVNSGSEFFKTDERFEFILDVAERGISRHVNDLKELRSEWVRLGRTRGFEWTAAPDNRRRSGISDFLYGILGLPRLPVGDSTPLLAMYDSALAMFNRDAKLLENDFVQNLLHDKKKLQDNASVFRPWTSILFDKSCKLWNPVWTDRLGGTMRQWWSIHTLATLERNSIFDNQSGCPLSLIKGPSGDSVCLPSGDPACSYRIWKSYFLSTSRSNSFLLGVA